MFQFRFQRWQQDERVGPWVRRFTGRSPWVWMTVLLVGVLPFALAAMFLALGAVLVCSVLYTALGAVDEGLRRVAGLFGGDRSSNTAGRRNVRVVKPEER